LRQERKVNFGDILEKWEKSTPTGAIYDKDFLVSRDVDKLRDRNSPAGRRSRLLHKKPDASLDLHGLNCEEAWKALHDFFEDSRWRRLEKLLIIHGKGNHFANLPSGEGALRDLTKRFIESCSYAGESGFSPSKGGGRGATWVFLKEIK
jgi:DNA-nicking Smr family endonuclease